MRIINRLFVALFKLYDIGFGYLALVGLWLRFGWGYIPSDLELGRKVKILITDNGNVKFDKGGSSISEYALILVKYGRLEVGSNCHIGRGTVICCRDSISIGKNVLIAEYVTIRDQDHLFGRQKTTADAGFITAPVKIGDNVWLGAKVTVTKGVTIGDNAVVGANSVVTKDVPAGVIVAGIPAQIIGDTEKAQGKA